MATRRADRLSESELESGPRLAMGILAGYGIHHYKLMTSMARTTSGKAFRGEHLSLARD